MAEYRVQATLEVAKSGEYTLQSRDGAFCAGHCWLGAAATRGSSRRNGRTEKNLFRQGLQRNAGSLRIRQKIAVTLGTRSAEIRCNSKLPQIAQRA
jgi:hypothetical protein